MQNVCKVRSSNCFQPRNVYKMFEYNPHIVKYLHYTPRQYMSKNDIFYQIADKRSLKW